MKTVDEYGTVLSKNKVNEGIPYPRCPRCGSTTVFMESYIRYCAPCWEKRNVKVEVEIPFAFKMR